MLFSSGLKPLPPKNNSILSNSLCVIVSHTQAASVAFTEKYNSDRIILLWKKDLTLWLESSFSLHFLLQIIYIKKKTQNKTKHKKQQ